MDDIDRAFELEPDRPSLFVVKGELLDKFGQRNQAQAAWRQALELDPNYLPALTHLGQVDQSSERLDRISEAVHAGLGVNPQSPNLHKQVQKLALRKLVFLVWAASVPGIVAFFLLAKPNHRVSVFDTVAVLAAVALVVWYTWRWRQRLTVIEQRELVHGSARYFAWFAAAIWLALLLLAVARLAFNPTLPERGPHSAGLAEVMMNACLAVWVVIATWWFVEYGGAWLRRRLERVADRLTLRTHAHATRSTVDRSTVE